MHCCRPLDERHSVQMLNGKEGFLSTDRLKKFSTHRNDPNQPEALSGLSPYYHFGHLAAQRSALEASKLRSKAKVNSLAFNLQCQRGSWNSNQPAALSGPVPPLWSYCSPAYSSCDAAVKQL